MQQFSDPCINSTIEMFRKMKERDEERRKQEEGYRIKQEETCRIKQEEIRQQMQRQSLLFHDNPRAFLETEGLYRYDPDGCISSQELYEIYRAWCIRNRLPLCTPREFWLDIKHLAPQYQLRYSGQVPDSRGKRVRGFRGIRALTGEEQADL